MFYFLGIQQEIKHPSGGSIAHQIMRSALGRKISVEGSVQIGARGVHYYRVSRESLTHKVVSFKQRPKGGRELLWQREQQVTRTEMGLCVEE